MSGRLDSKRRAKPKLAGKPYLAKPKASIQNTYPRNLILKKTWLSEKERNFAGEGGAERGGCGVLSDARIRKSTPQAPGLAKARPPTPKTKKDSLKLSFLMSGRLDSNQRPPTPEAGALTGLRYTPNCHGMKTLNCFSSSRGSGIRTHDPLLPKQVR